MKEKDFQTKFSRWLRHNNHQTAAYELKATPGGSLLFSAVAVHQVEALTNANEGFIVYKIPDDTIGQKPFDCIKMVTVAAYVAILFYCRKNPREFYLIEINDFIKESTISDRKSLTEVRANQIGIMCHFDVIER